jgi:hypothetical protein
MIKLIHYDLHDNICFHFLDCWCVPGIVISAFYAQTHLMLKEFYMLNSCFTWVNQVSKRLSNLPKTTWFVYRRLVHFSQKHIAWFAKDLINFCYKSHVMYFIYIKFKFYLRSNDPNLNQRKNEYHYYYCWCFRSWVLYFPRGLYSKLLKEKNINLLCEERILSMDSYLVWQILTLTIAAKCQHSSQHLWRDSLFLDTQMDTTPYPEDGSWVVSTNSSSFFPFGKWLQLSQVCWMELLENLQFS